MANEFKFLNSVDNFEDVVQNIKDYYSSLNYNFANGSNFDTLARTFAWFKMSTGQDISNLTNNLYLSSVNNKNSAFELAKSNGYIVRRNIPSRVKTKLIYNGTDQTSAFVAKNITITGSNNNFDYFANNVSFSKSNITGNFEAIFDCQEKSKVTITYLCDGSKNQIIVLPETNITDDEIVITSKIGNISYNWELAQSFGSIPQSSSSIYFLSMNSSENTQITFGNNVIGRVPQSNEVFTIEYYITNADLANNESEFSLKNIVVHGNNSNLNNISNYTLSTGISFGAVGNESIEEISINASKHFSSLNNNIVRRDFENLLQVQSDYVSYSNISNLENENSILSQYFLLLVPINYVNNQTIANSTNYTLPFKAIENLVVSTIEYDKFNTYFSDWIYITIASPTYLYYDIIPSIKVAKYKDFESVSNKVYTNLKNYVSNNLHGFNKSYYETNLITNIKENSDVVDVKIDNNYYVVFNRANIEDKKFFKIPANFIKNNFNHYNDLVNYDNYIYSYLKDADKTIISDNLKTSSEGFIRYFSSTNEQSNINSNVSQIFDLAFDTTSPYAIVNELSQIFRINTNNVYIDVKVYPVTNGVNKYALYTSNSTILQQQVATYTISSNTQYLVYLSYNGINYLFAEIKQIDNYSGLKVLEQISNLFYVDNLFSDLNINTENEFLTFGIGRILDETGKSYWKLIGNVKISESTVSFTQTNLMLTSRKEVCNFDFLNNTLNQIDTNIIASIINESGVEKIELTANGTSVCKIIKNDTNLEVDENSFNSYPSTIVYQNYKNNKFFVEQDFDIYRVYVFENIDNSIVARVDNVGGNITFNDNITYKENNNLDIYKNIELSLLFDKILDENKIYRLNLISKNYIPSFTNITDDFESNDNIFTLPNLSLITEIQNNNGNTVNE